MSKSGMDFYGCHVNDQLHLKEREDPIKDIPLPEGSTPLWIIRHDSFPIGGLLRLLENEFIERSANVTIACDPMSTLLYNQVSY